MDSFRDDPCVKIGQNLCHPSTRPTDCLRGRSSVRSAARTHSSPAPGSMARGPLPRLLAPMRAPIDREALPPTTGKRCTPPADKEPPMLALAAWAPDRPRPPAALRPAHKTPAPPSGPPLPPPPPSSPPPSGPLGPRPPTDPTPPPQTPKPEDPRPVGLTVSGARGPWGQNCEKSGICSVFPQFRRQPPGESPWTRSAPACRPPPGLQEK